ncbi:MAG: amidohydrolase [Luminiphilus sp.]|jgi:predicted amidohydrolase YtcJ|nr:amidohydrolase [Luminiphilus sp.]
MLIPKRGRNPRRWHQALMWGVALIWSQAASAAADWVLRGGTVYSLDASSADYSALAMTGNRITWMGDSDAAAQHIGPDTEVVELAGRVVFPGFIDTHIHSMDTLPLVNGAMLSPYQSAEEVMATLAEHARKHPYQNPVLGSGFLAPAFGVGGPTAAQLDAIVPDRPALIIDEGGHTAWANTLALAAAGIDRDTPDPIPGAHFYKRDEDGVPTGWLVEGAAIAPVSEALKLVSEEALALAAPAFFREMSAVGLTAAFDAGMIETGELGRQLGLKMAESGALPLRMVASLYVNQPEQLTDALLRLSALNRRYQHELFAVTTLKLSLDGTVEARTAVMLEPYILPEGHQAQPLLPNPAMFDAVDAAHAANIDLHLHAIGDGAVRAALDAIERAKDRHPASVTRTAICHIEIVSAPDVARFSELGAVAQTTPTWFYYDDLALEYLGTDRFNQMYPLESILRHGGKVTLGSDYPVSWIGKDALNPMFNIEMAVTRQQAGNPEVPVQPRASERLSVDQAIRAHTVDAAWQLRLEDQIGTLEVGKLADIVVLDRDPYLSDPYALHRVLVDHTFSNGRLVFSRP